MVHLFFTFCQQWNDFRNIFTPCEENQAQISNIPFELKLDKANNGAFQSIKNKLERRTQNVSPDKVIILSQNLHLQVESYHDPKVTQGRDSKSGLINV